ncbi:hypothetical protein AAHA92_24208 [Salvia divinorum]|uniref:Uncharacterized protein n=1 Tax=Salvia divinorum TaxID=28513 RepID=A0ABD1G9T8_SALDI
MDELIKCCRFVMTKENPCNKEDSSKKNEVQNIWKIRNNNKVKNRGIIGEWVCSCMEMNVQVGERRPKRREATSHAWTSLQSYASSARRRKREEDKTKFQVKKIWHDAQLDD